MKALQVKSIVTIIILILTTTNVFSQSQTASGNLLDYTDKEEYFVGQNRRNLKVNFIGNFIGTTKISYEQILKPGRSFEIKATLVDMGEKGITGSIGYKIYRKPTFIAPNMQRRNILEGLYLKPEVFFGSVYNEGLLTSEDEAKPTAGILLNIGKQLVVSNSLILDLYVGAGAGQGDYFRGYLVGNGLVATAGLNLGFSF